MFKELSERSAVYKRIISLISWVIAIPINVILLPFVLFRMVVKGVK